MSVLETLLEQAGGYDAEYDGSLSNHLPMALAALARLGADDARLQAFAARYIADKRLNPVPPAEAWPAGEPWASRLGDPAAWPVYRDLFGAWLMHEGAGDVLEQALPTLLRGCGAAAFHGMIRTAYAVQSTSLRELADALAYWACRWFDLGGLPLPPGSSGGPLADPAEALAGTALRRSSAGLIAERMHAAAQGRAFEAAVARLRIDDNTLGRLARHAAALYAGSGNFTALHLVTSAHALRVLLPCVDAPLPALHAYWRAYVAGIAAAGATAGPAPAAKPWPALLARAVASDDDHVIKLVDSCREQERVYPGAVWRRAATRALR